jgi:hypothetical protein
MLKSLSPILVLVIFSLLNCNIIYSETLQQVKQPPLRAYVLTQEVGGRASGEPGGVRIGLIDMEFENQQSLEKYQLPKEIVKKLVPFAGLRGQRAVNTLKQKPLNLSQSEFVTINQKVKQYWMSRLDEAPSFVKNDPQVIFRKSVCFNFLNKKNLIKFLFQFQRLLSLVNKDQFAQVLQAVAPYRRQFPGRI